MTLTKKDLDKIKEIVDERVKTLTATPQQKLPDFDNWLEDAIETDCGITLAPEDFYVGKKKFFSWDEAMKYEEEILRPKGWRLPTVKEFEILYAHYGLSSNGKDNPDNLMEVCGFSRNGDIWSEENLEKYNSTFDEDLIEDKGSLGYYWSSTANSTATYAYNLTFSTSGVYPQDHYYKGLGFSVRCVAL